MWCRTAESPALPHFYLAIKVIKMPLQDHADDFMRQRSYQSLLILVTDARCNQKQFILVIENGKYTSQSQLQL